MDSNSTKEDIPGAIYINGTDVIEHGEISSVNSNMTSLQLANSTQNTTKSNDGVSSMVELRLSILAYILVAFMFLGCLRPSMPHTAHRQYVGEDDADLLERQRQRANQQRRRREKKKKNEMDPEERKKIIHASLVTTTIASCDEESGGVLTLSPACEENEQQSNTDQQQQQKNAEVDDYDDETSCSCMICLEPYVIGDKVSYSRHNALECRHVFHQECITDWLMRQDDCPCCRTPYIIKTDADDSTVASNDLRILQTNSQDSQDSGLEQGKGPEQNTSEATGVLYIVDGMISRNMYSLFSIGTDDGEEEEMDTSNTETDLPINQEEDADKTKQDTRPAQSGQRRSFIGRSLFGRSDSHIAAYTSVSISDNSIDIDIEDDDEGSVIMEL